MNFFGGLKKAVKAVYPQAELIEPGTYLYGTNLFSRVGK